MRAGESPVFLAGWAAGEGGREMEGWGWGQEYYTVNVNVRWDGEGFGWGKIWKRRREIKVAGEVGGHREVAVDPGGSPQGQF